MVDLAIEFADMPNEQCANQLCVKYKIGMGEASFLANEIEQFNKREDTLDARIAALNSKSLQNNMPSLVQLAKEYNDITEDTVEDVAEKIAEKYKCTDSHAYFLATEIKSILTPKLGVEYIMYTNTDMPNVEAYKQTGLYDSVEVTTQPNQLCITFTSAGIERFSKDSASLAIFSIHFTVRTDIFEKGDKRKFLDYTIEYCNNNDGIIMYKEGVDMLSANHHEQHLGNYATLDDAQTAAIVFFMIARPNIFAHSILNKVLGGSGTGTYHEYFLLKEQLRKEGIIQPSEITALDEPNNYLIGYKGQPLHNYSLRRKSKA